MQMPIGGRAPRAAAPEPAHDQPCGDLL